MSYRIFMIGFSANKGGVESYISNITNSLTSDFEVILSLPEMVIDGKRWVRPFNRHNYFAYRAFWRRFYSENHFDVVYFNTCDIVSIDALKFAAAAGVPVRIIHSHNTGVQQAIGVSQSLFHRWSERQSRKHLDKYATHLLACSESAGNWMFDGRPYKVIKNGITLSRYAYNDERKIKVSASQQHGEGLKIGAIGRLSPQKNVFYTLDIFEEILKQDATAHCYYIGDGEQRAELEQQISVRRLSERVTLVGAVPNVNEWVSYLDCLVMPSFFEGLPFVLVEAQAAGLHALVSDTVSQESNITGIVEFMSLQQSPEVWAQRLLEIACNGHTDVSEKLSAAGFSVEQSASVIMALIKNALKYGPNK